MYLGRIAGEDPNRRTGGIAREGLIEDIHELPRGIGLRSALVVRVVPEQFAWNIHYSGKDGKFGRTAPEFVSADNLLGLDPDDPDGNDDFNAINNLHIVKDRPVIAHISSKDVIHSIKIPVLRLTQDAIPGQDIRIWFEATRNGTFDIACAQLCGLGHYRMRGQLTVQPEAAFQAWFDEQSAAADEEDEFSF